MRVGLRVLGGLLALIVVALLALTAFVFFSARPQVAGTAELRGLSGPVTVTRDRWGVPHIRAQASDADALFALGYVHAQDRLWQMEFQRRVARGQLSEVLGGAALEQDKFLRTWGFYRAAEAALPALSARTRTLLSAYTAGVNAAISQGKLPLEFRVLGFRPGRWTDVDSLAWQKLMAFDLGGNWEQELNARRIVDRLGAGELNTLYPPYPAGAPTILSARDLKGPDVKAPDTGAVLSPTTQAVLSNQAALIASLGFAPAPDKGSNDWVVSGRLTKSGKPLLADDPHLALQAPMLWYLADLRGPTLHVIGATIPGLPGVVIGRNDRVAWGVTNTGPDVQDLYLEPPGSVLKERTEIIKVKGRPDVRLTVRESRHGPIITGTGGVNVQNVALRWTALDPGDTTLDAFLGINYARNWTDFTNALKRYVTPMQNFVYADVDGNIGYYAPGRVPIRLGWSGELPVAGDGAHEWAGFVPFEGLPHVYNPPEGLIVTANNKAVPDGYPYQLTNPAGWAPPYRAERILELLKGKTGLTARDMAAVQADTLSLLWQSLKPALLATRPQDERDKAALDVLRTWDGRQDMNSVGSSIFAAWYSRLAGMASDELGQSTPWNEPLFVAGQLNNNGKYCQNARAKIPGCAALLSATLHAAVQDLTGRLGEDMNAWQWDKLHRTASKHGAFGGVTALAWIWNRSVPSPGGLYTVDVGSYDLGTFVQDHGPSYRQVVDLANPDAGRFVGTLGQSGNPLSIHYADQEGLWQRGESLPMSANPANWGRVSVLELRPAR